MPLGKHNKYKHVHMTEEPPKYMKQKPAKRKTDNSIIIIKTLAPHFQ